MNGTAVGARLFTRTKVFCRYVFEIEVEDTKEVALNPWEHQDFVRAGADEVAGLVAEGRGGKTIELTRWHLTELLLEAFKSRRGSAKE